MPLEPGSTFGPYQIVAAIGAGGMGEVYRARDAKLQRDVALKLLPAHLRTDPERVGRFEREARALAVLNHAHIAHIYGFEEASGSQAIVMELVEGAGLDVVISDAARQGRGIGVRKALDIAGQIAHAIEAAHGQGILHRDLKPANVRVRPDGTAKVLDFGLAAIAPDRPSAEGSAPTATAFTQHGMAMGTPAYMSPEQARGDAVDRRTDIWAFGCLLFEMLSGSRAFDGRTSSDAIAALLTRDPDWSRIPATTPPAVVRVMRRCLQKDPASRLRDIADARLEIEDAVDEGSAAPLDARRVSRLLPWGWTAAVAAIVGIASGYAGLRLAPSWAPSAPVTRFYLSTLADEALALNEAGVPFAISPDGSKIVVSAGSWQGSQLYLRALGSPEPVAIPGTIAAFHPFFSPDGQWIAFLAGSVLKKVPSAGGPTLTIGEIAGRRIQGGVWSPEGIFIAPGDGAAGLAKVSADGGVVQAVTTVNREGGETSHRYPESLPGGTHLVFTVHFRNGSSQVVIQSLATGERQVLFQGASRARYVPGYLVYAQGSDLFAAPFDAGRRVLTGAAARVMDNVSLGFDGVDAQYDVAQNGTLVHQQRVRRDQRVMSWVDRRGQRTALGTSPRGYDFPRLSPDGQTITTTVRQDGQWDLWVYRPQTQAFTRVTFDANVNNAEWTPDGQALVYGASDEDRMSMFLQNIDGSTARQRLFGPASGLWPGSWTSDGQTLLFMEDTPISGDLKLFKRGSTTTTVLIGSNATEWGARISPDNRWMAYVSNESGQWQVYAQPFPGPGGRLQLSTEGGSEVVWARDGRELFYRNGPRMMAVAIDSGARLAVGQTTILFEAALAPGQPGLPNYDVRSDGRFLMIELGPEERRPRRLEVTLNWPQLVRSMLNP